MILVYLARFFAGAFLANAVPHFVCGTQGRPFPSPFASPPGRGDSSPAINVLWGAANAAIAYLLFYRVGSFAMTHSLEVLVAGLGGLVMSVQLASHFGQVYAAKAERRG